jgi:hypothetical protein
MAVRQRGFGRGQAVAPVKSLDELVYGETMWLMRCLGNDAEKMNDKRGGTPSLCTR